MNMERVIELYEESPYKNLTYKEAKDIIMGDNPIKEGMISADIIAEHGKHYYNKLIISYFTVNILTDLSVPLKPDDMVLEETVKRLRDIDFQTTATTIQFYLKDYIAHTIVMSDYSNLSYDSVVNLMQVRQALITMAGYLPSSIVGRKGEGMSIVRGAIENMGNVQRLD